MRNCLFVATIIITGSVILRTLKATGVPFKVLLDKQWASLMINLTTSSQVAALTESLKCCKEKFGIDPKLVDFSLPLCTVVYMPNGAAFLAFTAWTVAVLSGTPVDFTAAVLISVVSVIFAIFCPPIPDAAFCHYAHFVFLVQYPDGLLLRGCPCRHLPRLPLPCLQRLLHAAESSDYGLSA